MWWSSSLHRTERERVMRKRFGPGIDVSGYRCGGTAGWKVVFGMVGLIFCVLGVVFVTKDNFIIERDGAYFQARISASKDAMWGAGRGGKEGLMVDDWLQASTVVLDSGDAEIEFDSGAIVSLRGPAQFEVSSPNRGSLVYGILRVEVPELAEAFTVHTPWAEAIATNALFGLSVSKDDRTDLHVLQGQVEFARREGRMAAKSGIIPGGSAVRVVSSNVPERVEVSAGLFAFDLPAPAEGSPLLSRWSFDAKSDGGWADSGRGWVARALSGDEVASPSAGVIRFESAAVLTAESPLTEPKKPVTVWARVKVADGACWIRYWSDKRYSRHWGLGVESRGEGARVRLETGTRQYRGYASLDDGEWHDIIAVLIPSADFRGTADLRVYVDGQLEGLSRMTEELVIDRDVESPYVEVSGSGGVMLDEVRLIGHAVRPRDIRRGEQP